MQAPGTVGCYKRTNPKVHTVLFQLQVATTSWFPSPETNLWPRVALAQAAIETSSVTRLLMGEECQAVFVAAQNVDWRKLCVVVVLGVVPMLGLFSITKHR